MFPILNLPKSFDILRGSPDFHVDLLRQQTLNHDDITSLVVD